jgi:hypothetical protein
VFSRTAAGENITAKSSWLIYGKAVLKPLATRNFQAKATMNVWEPRALRPNHDFLRS